MEEKNSRRYDVVIVGGGVSGTALFYTLSKYTNIKRVALLEKYDRLALVNSNYSSNSQTLHFGDIETNYTLEKATKVKAAAEMVRRYVEAEKKRGVKKKLFTLYHKMVLAVGDEQVDELERRYEEFKGLFPEAKLLNREEIAKVEPKVIEGRDKNQKLLALFSPNGYTMDYRALSESFAENALEISKKKKTRFELFLNIKLLKIERADNGFKIYTNNGVFTCDVAIISAGGHSLLIAKSLGYGKDFSILSVAGSFYFVPKALNGKVYTMQIKKLPFAAIHGDPDVHDQSKTRFGPTAKVIPLLERYNYSSFFEYFKTFGFGIRQIVSLFRILSDWTVLKYIVTQFMYDMPIIGKGLFLREVRKVVPSVKLSDLEFAKKTGGTRPQIINLKTKKLDLGEAKILGEKCIFNITPSPGASTCLRNSYEDTKKIMEFFGGRFMFMEKEFRKELVDWNLHK